MRRLPPTPPLAGNRARARAFTLIEMLVAVAVLALLVALIAQLFGHTSRSAAASGRHLDADGQARLAFDRMADDFGRMLLRRNVDSLFLKQPGNDRIVFYSQAPGFADGAGQPGVTALVGYRINTARQLERLGKQLNWDGPAGAASAGAPLFLTWPDGSANPDPASTIASNWASALAAADGTGDWHVLGDGIFRFEFCFLKSDGTYLNPPAPDAAAYVYPLQGVVAVVVAIAILDASSRKLAADLSGLPGALPDPGTLPPLMDAVWNGKLGDLARTAGIPAAAAAQVRVYQRTFFLGVPPNGP